MTLHELKILHEYLVDVDLGKKTFELRKNDRDYQVGDLIRFIDVREDDYTANKNKIEPNIDENTLYRITYVLKDVREDDSTANKNRIEPNIDENTLYRITYVLKGVEQYGIDRDYCILAIKKLEIKEV